MTTSFTPRLRTSVLVLFFALFTLNVSASTLELEVTNGRVTLQADEVSLDGVFRKLSNETGIVIESLVPLTRPVTLEVRNRPVEQAIESILKNYSYTFGYVGDELSRVKVLSLKGEVVESHGPVITIGPEPEAEIVVQPEVVPEPPTNRLVARLEEINLSTGDFVLNGVVRNVGASSMGLRVDRLPAGSVLSEIGLREGDQVGMVGGVEVGDEEEFISALKGAATRNEALRIDRPGPSGQMEPVYLPLEEPPED